MLRGMAFRDDLQAAQARADALEQRVVELEAEKQRADDMRPPPEQPAKKVLWIVLGALAIPAFGAALYGLYTVGGAPALVLGCASMLSMGISVGVLLACTEVVHPGQLLVLSGRPRRRADGTMVAYRVVTQGRVVRLPLIERVDRMDVRPMTEELSLRQAYCQGSRPVDIRGTLRVRIATEPPAVDDAINRFLGRNPREVAQVARETVEGGLRSAVASLTPEQVQSDPTRLAEALTSELEGAMHSLGLVLEALHIEDVQTTTDR